MNPAQWQWQYVHTEIAVFLAGCIAAGALIGLLHHALTSPPAGITSRPEENRMPILWSSGR